MEIVLERHSFINYLDNNNYKREEFCKICNINNETFNNLLLGNKVKASVIFKIAELLKINVAFLFAENNYYAKFI